MTPANVAYEKRDSGIPWIGEMPAHWSLGRYKRIFRERDERSADGNETLLSVSAYTGVSPRSGLIEDGELEHRAATLEGYKKCQAGDLVMNIMLAWNRAQGITRFDGIVSPAYSVFEVVDDADDRFLDYLVRCDTTIAYFKAWSYGIIDSRLRLYPETFGSLFCALPPKNEQSLIADCLDRATFRIDVLVAKKTRFIGLLREKRQALITHAVTKGLDASVPMKESGVEWLGRVPAHWKVGQLRRFTRSRCDGPFGSGLKSSNYTNCGARVVRLQNIGSASFKADNAAFIDIDYWRSVLGGGHDVVGGDLLMAGLGDDNNPLGRACVAPDGIGPALVKADCYRFRLTQDVNAHFVALALSATARSECGLLANGATRDRLNLGLASARVIPAPPLSEQDEIVADVERVTARIDTLLAKTEHSIKLLREHRTALITAAVTGRIDLRAAA